MIFPIAYLHIFQPSYHYFRLPDCFVRLIDLSLSSFLSQEKTTEKFNFIALLDRHGHRLVYTPKT